MDTLLKPPLNMPVAAPSGRAYPLGSTTEPRYAEIARKMLETGNWVTPWFDHGVPFWGKPPLSFWGSAATMAVLGVNEFAVRLAPFLAAVGTGALFWAWPRREAQRTSAARAQFLPGRSRPTALC